MTKFNRDDTKRIEEVRAQLAIIEEALSACTWTTKEDIQQVKTGMTWIRDHWNRGRTNPSPTEIHANMFTARAGTEWALENILEALARRTPETSLMQEQGPRLLAERCGLYFLNWQPPPDRYGNDHFPPNFRLPEDHPDRTDQAGLPFYFPRDEHGALLHTDEAKLSHHRSAQRARQRFGHTPSIHPYRKQRVKLPTMTTYMRRQQEEQLAHLSGDVDLSALRAWVKEHKIEPQLTSYREQLEAQQKNRLRAYKEGLISREESKLDIDLKVLQKRQALERVLQEDHTSALQAFINEYKASTQQQEALS